MLKCRRGSGDQQGAHLSSLSFWITAGNYPSPSIPNTHLSERSKDTTATGLITCKRWCAEAECYGLHCLFKSMLGGLCSFAKEGWQGSKATEAKAAKKVLKTELSLWPEGIPANTTLCTREPPSLQRHAAVQNRRFVWIWQLGADSDHRLSKKRKEKKTLRTLRHRRGCGVPIINCQSNCKIY